MSDLENSSDKELDNEIDILADENLSVGDLKFIKEVKQAAEEAKKEDVSKDTKSEMVSKDTKTVEEDSLLAEAVKMGYNPDYEGDNFVSPKEFIRVGKMIKAKEDKIEGLSSAVNKLLEHNKKVEMLAYERAMKDLGAAKNEAIKEGDVGKVHKLDQEIIKTYNESPIAQAKSPDNSKPTLNKATQDFVARNTWFNGDPENVDIASAAIHTYNYIKDSYIRKGLLKANEAISNDMDAKMLADVERSIKSHPDFVHKFEKTGATKAKESKVAMVESPSRSAPSKSITKLTYEDRVQLKQIQMADKKFTESDYIKLKDQVSKKS